MSKRVSTTVTVKVPVVWRPGADGVMTAPPGPAPITRTCAEVWPSGIVTLDVTVATLVSLEERLITCPPAGAAALMKTEGLVPNDGPLKVLPEAGAKVMLTAWTSAVIEADRKTPEGAEAVIVELPAALPVIVAVPELNPSWITIDAGGSAAAVFE